MTGFDVILFSLLYELVQRGGASLVWVKECGCTSVYSVCEMYVLYNCDMSGQAAIKWRNITHFAYGKILLLPQGCTFQCI